ncbi:XRE family transcriptional regulator [Lactobacillus xujianguonis]|uniref:XRE family transcriptional regulator n=1 Tax=Lactobacillus xujianguonis TaxID=2495899 RepID=A0A437SY12_9LACO|nr:helix-turn-helix transcriptional regulator [Lactobacillus xujianguonis]RVU71813.1 XRE family transcriptional regulator [Lactobacillus xujianguonis]
MSVYENIKEIAQEHGLSIKEVATKAGIGENSIYRWRTSNLSTGSLQKVADALHVDVNDLTVKDDETPEFRTIQRNAKKLNRSNQKKLLDIMKAAFGDAYGNDTNK